MKKDTLAPEQHYLLKTVDSLTDQIELFEMVQDLSQKIISGFDLDNILQTFSGIINEVAGFGTAAIYLFDGHDPRFFKEVHCSGIEKGKMAAHLPDRNIISWVMSQARWTMLTDPQDDPDAAILSILPVCTLKRQSGFMVMMTDPAHFVYNQKLISILSFVASQTAIAIENQDLYSQVNQSTMFLSNIVESISNGILVTDMAGSVTLLNKNATALLGIKSEKVVGKNYKKFLSGTIRKEVEKIHEHIMDKGFVSESMISHVPYREVHISMGITASRLTDRHRKMIGIIFIFRDMSASKEIQRLKRLDAMKSEFVSNVSHEIRTPLSIIKSYSEALLDQVEPDDHQTRNMFLSIIDDQTDNLTNIVGNLLDLSRIESGRFELNYSRVRLKDLVDSVIKGFTKKLQHMTVYTRFEKDLPPIDADVDRIREVVTNLIDNSIKFSPEGGIINIEAVHKGDEVICSVSDTGIGIPEDQIPRIFDKFFRVDNSDTYEIEGTGLGLSIVKHIILFHGGSIIAESKPGKGSVFTFSLPVKGGGGGIQKEHPDHR